MRIKQTFSRLSCVCHFGRRPWQFFARKGASGTAKPDAGSGASVVGRVKFRATAAACARQHGIGPELREAAPGARSGPGLCSRQRQLLGKCDRVCLDGLGNRTFDVPTEAVTFEQKGCIYEPHVVAVRANQS